jgi:RNA polymerase sigma-70 factor (ECF subfamily)
MAVTEEERVIVVQAIKKDREAFADLWVLYKDRVYQRVSSIIRQPDLAEDITSEAFLRAWNAIDKYEPRDVTILAWLCRIAERVAFRELKRQKPTTEIDGLMLEADAADSPEYIAEQKAGDDDMLAALHRLPETQRQVLSKRFIDDLSYDDVSKVLGKSVGSVRLIQHRALKALKLIVTERQRLAATMHSGAPRD